MNKLVLFMGALAAPVIYWRVLFYLIRPYLNAPFTRTKTGLQVHHLHYGIVFALIGASALAVDGNMTFVIIMLGVGLGLIMDEFFFTLEMPGDRPLELEVYRKSLTKTIYLFLAMFVILASLGFVSGKF